MCDARTLWNDGSITRCTAEATHGDMCYFHSKCRAQLCHPDMNERGLIPVCQYDKRHVFWTAPNVDREWLRRHVPEGVSLGP